MENTYVTFLGNDSQQSIRNILDLSEIKALHFKVQGFLLMNI